MPQHGRFVPPLPAVVPVASRRPAFLLTPNRACTAETSSPQPWLGRPPPAPPTTAYLNLIEPWWKVLRSLALKGQRFETWADIEHAITHATTDWNAHRHPFVWGRHCRHRARRPRASPSRLTPRDLAAGAVRRRLIIARVIRRRGTFRTENTLGAVEHTDHAREADMRSSSQHVPYLTRRRRITVPQSLGCDARNASGGALALSRHRTRRQSRPVAGRAGRRPREPAEAEHMRSGSARDTPRCSEPTRVPRPVRAGSMRRTGGIWAAPPPEPPRMRAPTGPGSRRRSAPPRRRHRVTRPHVARVKESGASGSGRRRRPPGRTG